MITDRCLVLSCDMPSDHTTSVNISSKSTTSEYTADINSRRYGKIAPMQKIGTNIRKYSVFEKQYK